MKIISYVRHTSHVPTWEVIGFVLLVFVVAIAFAKLVERLSGGPHHDGWI